MKQTHEFIRKQSFIPPCRKKDIMKFMEKSYLSYAPEGLYMDARRGEKNKS